MSNYVWCRLLHYRPSISSSIFLRGEAITARLAHRQYGMRRYFSNLTRHSTFNAIGWFPSYPSRTTQLSPQVILSKVVLPNQFLRWMSQKLDVLIDEKDRMALDPYEERMLNELIQYKEKHGDCHVPGGTGHLFEEERSRLGVSEELGTWVSYQRQRYKSLQKGKIKSMTKQDQVRIVVLESMGFMWGEREAQWQRSFNRFESLVRLTGTLNVNPQEYPQLWNWTDQQRKAYRQGKLSKERTDLLNELGFVFDLQDAAWWQYFDRLSAFATKTGHANPPTHGVDDPSLGAWVARQRRHQTAGELSQERVDALEKIGFSFDVHGDRWMMQYRQLVTFYEKHGHTRVPVSEGVLWQWVDRQRRKLRQLEEASTEERENSSESASKIMALNKIHFDWSFADDEERAKRLMDLTFSVDIQDERWIENYTKLCAFKERFGHFLIPPNHPDYHELASWAKHQRFLNKRDRLPLERIAALDELGFIWSGQAARWDKFYQELVRFRAKHGHTRIPTKNRELYRWISQQRKALKTIGGRTMTNNGKNNNNNTDSLPTSDLDGTFNPRLLELEKILSEE